MFFLTFLIFIKNEIKFSQCYKMYPISFGLSWICIPFFANIHGYVQRFRHK